MTDRRVERVEDLARRAQAIEVGRRGFGIDDEPSRFLAARLQAVRRSVAATWLLTEDGDPVASLLAYPLTLRRPDGRDVDGVGLGAVATIPEARGRGHAEHLCRTVVEDAEASGRPLSILFSAIGTKLYERVGFRTAAGWGHSTTELDALAHATEPLGLAPIDPRAARADLDALWADWHAGTLHVRRDAAAWTHGLAVNPDDLWLGVGDPLTGYARVEITDDTLYLSELILADRSQEAGAFSSLARYALRWGCTKFTTWHPPTPGLEGRFEDLGRPKTLPMLRGEADESLLRIWPSDYF